jgi:signal transduction histidine kinase
MPDSSTSDSAFARARAQLENAIGATSDADGRAKRCTAVLRTAWPGAVVCAARVGDATVALDAAGQPCDPPDDLRDTGLLIAPLAFAGESFGRFAVALPDSSPDDALRLELLALNAASALAAERVSPEEASERDWLMRVGEVVGPVTHEFNNFLNTLLLQVAVMELTAPETVRAELGAIRAQGRSMAALIRLLQQYRRQYHAELKPIDLNAVVRSAATHHGRLRLGDGLPPTIGYLPDVQRLVGFLLVGAAALSDGDIDIATAATSKSVTLTVTVSGGTNPGRFASVVEGPGIVVNEPHALELAACHSLTRRLNGALRTGGTGVVVELPIA